MRTRLGALLLVAGSCGPATPMDATGTTEPTSATTSSSTDASSTDASTTTASPTTAATGSAGEESSTGGEGTSTGSETGEASVTVATTDTTAADATTADTTVGESATGEPGGVVYTAEYYVGQINRITVYRADFDADNCTFIKLSETGSDPDTPVTLPPFWQVEWTHVAQGTASCFGGEPPGAWEAADSVMGMVDFDLSMSCTLDIDVKATFPQSEPWVPLEIHFLATDVPVDGPC